MKKSLEFYMQIPRSRIDSVTRTICLYSGEHEPALTVQGCFRDCAPTVTFPNGTACFGIQFEGFVCDDLSDTADGTDIKDVIKTLKDAGMMDYFMGYCGDEDKMLKSYPEIDGNYLVMIDDKAISVPKFTPFKIMELE